MKGRARVLDSTPLHDAVATQDTVTQLRAAIRKLLIALEGAASGLAEVVRSALDRDDAYDTVGKPPCDWDDKDAREALVDALVRDAHATLGALDGETLPAGAGPAAELLALVAGQDTEAGDDGVSHRPQSGQGPGRLHGRPRGPPRPQARHRRFDGYKAHVSVDPDSELIDEVAVTPANRPDRDAMSDLLEGFSDADDKPDIVGDSAPTEPPDNP